MGKGNFVEYNHNPKGIKAGDCVIRAVGFGLGISWYEAFDMLTKVARENCWICSIKETYKKLLEDKGIKMEKQLRKTNGKKYTLNEFCELNSEGTYIVGINCHLTVVKDGKIYDTWDCGEWVTGNYWKVK